MKTPLLLPNDPPATPAPLHEALSATLAAIAAGEPAMLPAVVGVDGRTLARWLYRAWLEALGEWRPLLHLRADLGVESMRAAVAETPGGWVQVGAGARPAALAALVAATRAADAALLIDDDRPIPAPATWVDRLRALDQHHGVATDPALGGVRSALLAAARRGGSALICGPSGSGRRDLVRWAHALLDDQPLTLVARGAPGHPVRERWALFEELAELDDDARAALRQRLDLDLRSPAPPASTSRRAPRPTHPAFSTLRGESAALASVLADAALAAPRSLPVLLLGEPGVGKELLARAIHEASGRKGPLVTVDLSTLNEELIPSELFGHVKGAFTGADRERAGAFRTADGGTLFLDELGNIPYKTQPLLLRALQEGEIRPVGSDRVMKVNVRIVAATNADLQAMVQRGTFREDLLSRVAGVTLRLPPLRERPEDILTLAASALLAERGDAALPSPWASPEAEAALIRWPWSTNVRELRHTMARVAWQTNPGERVELRHLGPLAQPDRAVATFVTIQESPDDPAAFPGLERRAVTALRATTLRVSSLDERGPRSIRHLARTILDGHPITEEALALLAGRRWPGNLPELSAALAALRVEGSAGIDADLVRRVLPVSAPALAQGELRSWGAGLRVLMDPTLGSDGAVHGDIRDFSSRDVLVGRGNGLKSLEEEAQRDPGGAQAARLSALRALVEGEPDTLRLRKHPELSRAHLLLRRRGDQIEALEVPGVSVPVLAGALDAERRARVSNRTPTPLGAACELLLQRVGEPAPTLRLYVFATEDAWRRWSRVALERDMGRSASSATLQEAEEVETEARTGSRRVWALSEAEAALLMAVVLDFGGGDFQAHVRQELQRHVGPAAARLRAYLIGAPTAQYTARLYQHNPAATAQLAGALEDELLARLPGQLRKVLEPLRPGPHLRS